MTGHIVEIHIVDKKIHLAGEGASASINGLCVQKVER
jgi:hypothetical protein